MTDICPFCGRDPFHYVDNGVGMEAVAVTCCELGDEFFRGMRPAPEEVTLSWEDFQGLGNKLAEFRRKAEEHDDALAQGKNSELIRLLESFVDTEAFGVSAWHYRREIIAALRGLPAEGRPGNEDVTDDQSNLILLAHEIEQARKAFLDGFGQEGNAERKAKLAQLLWDDKCTIINALRAAAERQSPAATETYDVKLEARPAAGGEWTMIYPAQLEWVVKQGHEVRATETVRNSQPVCAENGELADTIDAVIKNFGATCDASDIARGLQAHFNVTRKNLEEPRA